MKNNKLTREEQDKELMEAFGIETEKKDTSESERREFLLNMVTDYQKENEHLKDVVKEAQAMNRSFLDDCQELDRLIKATERLVDRTDDPERKEAYWHELNGLLMARDIMRQ